MNQGPTRHTERRETKTLQGYPIILNNIGDKIRLRLRDDHGIEYTETAEVAAVYRDFVLLHVCGKYRTTVHKTEFGQYKGAKVRWDKYYGGLKIQE